MGASADDRGAEAAIRSINAVTLATTDMPRAVAFYGALGLRASYGDADAAFTILDIGADEHLNLALRPVSTASGGATGAGPAGWGRVIFHLSDIAAVDALYRHAIAAGLEPEGRPRDGEWGERYFHLRDPDGHELSFAARLPVGSTADGADEQ